MECSELSLKSIKDMLKLIPNGVAVCLEDLKEIFKNEI